MSAVTTEVGKREAHKIATRAAIQAAADALFDERGYTNTTVRDIADAAGVTERTLFRYFSGKEALLVKDVEAWLPILGDEIRRRPTEESPLDAVENAFLALLPRVDDATHLSWLFHDGPPGPRLEKSAPGLLLQFEGQIADALIERAHVADSDSPDIFRCQVLARCAVAALRSAGLRRWQLRDDAVVPSETELISQAFAVLKRPA